LASESRDEVYKDGNVKSWILAEGLVRQLSLGYRALVVIESRDYMGHLLELLKSAKERLGLKKVLYAFHPWKEGAKDRLKAVKGLWSELDDVDYSSSESVLGTTYDLVVLDCVDDFRPNYLARLIDVVRGGGFAIIYSDDISSPSKLYKSTLVRHGRVSDLFEERFRKLLKAKEGLVYVNDEGVTFKPYLRPPRIVEWRNFKGVRVTNDQLKILEESDFLFHSEDPRALVITAPRGRGKSFVTGLLVGSLLRGNEGFRAVVTSPSLLNSQEVFRGASALKGIEALRAKSGLMKAVRFGSSVAEWLPPDMASYAEGDLLVIDEFAAVPNELLEEALRKWRKVIMTSTTFGYEGSGKAFRKSLERAKESHLVKHVTMEEPIRFPHGDPVEAFVNDAFLLKVEQGKVVGESEGVREVSREELANSESLLRSAYSILLTAHYRNSPDDLMFLLDMEFQRVLVNFHEGKAVGVAQLVYEGGLNESETEKLMKGEENPGHLIPQRIVGFLGLKEFGRLSGLRVMRIAVLEGFQRKGFGSQLLRKAEELAASEGLDWIGSSFVGDYGVLSFWVRNGYLPVYVTSRGNEALAGFSIIVLKGLKPNVTELVRRLNSRLKERLVLTAHQVYYKMNPKLLALLLKSTGPLSWNVEAVEEDFRAAERYLDGEVPYNAVAHAFHKLLLKALSLNDLPLSEESLALMAARVLQGRSWSQTAVALNLGGSSNAEKAFREAARSLLNVLISNRA